MEYIIFGSVLISALGRARIDYSDVNKIRVAWCLGTTLEQLSNIYGIWTGTVSRILHGQSWVSR